MIGVSLYSPNSRSTSFLPVVCAFVLTERERQRESERVTDKEADR